MHHNYTTTKLCLNGLWRDGRGVVSSILFERRPRLGRKSSGIKRFCRGRSSGIDAASAVIARWCENLRRAPNVYLFHARISVRTWVRRYVTTATSYIRAHLHNKVTTSWPILGSARTGRLCSLAARSDIKIQYFPRPPHPLCESTITSDNHHLLVLS